MKHISKILLASSVVISSLVMMPVASQAFTCSGDSGIVTCNGNTGGFGQPSPTGGRGDYGGGGPNGSGNGDGEGTGVSSPE